MRKKLYSKNALELPQRHEAFSLGLNVYHWKINNISPERTHNTIATVSEALGNCNYASEINRVSEIIDYGTDVSNEAEGTTKV